MKSIYLGVLLFSLVAFVSAKTTLGTKQVSFGGACFFKCPNPDEVPMPIPDFQAVPDGCKLGGITIKTKWDFTSCCNQLDDCYGTCNRRKKVCDRQFQECMTELCQSEAALQEERGCAGEAKTHLNMAKQMGCDVFKKGQEEACSCVKKEL